MFCRGCGAHLGDASQFCSACGLAVSRPTESDAPTAGASVASAVDHSATVHTVGTQQLTESFQAAPPAAAPVQKRSRAGVWVAIAVAVVALFALLGAGALLYFRSTPEFLDAIRARSSANTAESPEKDEGDESADANEVDGEAVSADTDESQETLSADESYQILTVHYVTLWDLHSEIGLANTDGSYGGVGFAYDVFNPKIGNPDYAVRAELVVECQALMDEVDGARVQLASVSLDEAYIDQQDALLALYDLLSTRVGAMLGAATIAVDNPDESAWRSTLSPASLDSRKQFEEAYPAAEPASL